MDIIIKATIFACGAVFGIVSLLLFCYFVGAFVDDDHDDSDCGTNGIGSTGVY